MTRDEAIERCEALRHGILQTRPAESGVAIGCFVYCPFCQQGDPSNLDATMEDFDHDPGCLWLDAKERS